MNPPADLRNGTSYYDGQIAVLYYLGDGINTSVTLPAGKTVDILTPLRLYIVDPREDGAIIVFANAIPAGLLVTITLKDSDDA